MTSARMKPRCRSEWITPAHSGARAPAPSGQRGGAVELILPDVHHGQDRFGGEEERLLEKLPLLGGERRPVEGCALVEEALGLLQGGDLGQQRLVALGRLLLTVQPALD